MTEKNQDKINEMQLLQQNLQNLLMQRQQFQMRLTEIDGALNELKDTNQAFKIVGGIMVAKDKEDIKKDLEEKKSMIDIRLKNISSQEENLKGKAEDLQKELVSEMKK